MKEPTPLELLDDAIDSYLSAFKEPNAEQCYCCIFPKGIAEG